jgi:glycosyltransferase involved in cell wall biosynthesis
VVPCYNKGNNLIACAESVKYILDDIEEVIFVNDCGSDGSFDKLKCLYQGREKFIFIENKTNTGPSLTRKLGADKCSSYWVGFLDADDVLHPESSRLIQEIKSRDNSEGVSVCYGISSRSSNVCFRDRLLARKRQFGNSLSWFLIKKPNMSNIFVARRDFLNCDALKSNVRWGEDVLLFFELLEKGRFVKYPFVFSDYKAHLGERGKSKDFSARMYLVKKCASFLIKSGRWADFPYFIYFGARAALSCLKK